MLNLQVTDSIPRVAIKQILDSLSYIHSLDSATTFDKVRIFLQKHAKRKAPSSREWMWTVARDILTDLDRLGLIKAGVLPRKRSEVERLQETPILITGPGIELAQTYEADKSRAFDNLLVIWLNNHYYFRLLVAKLIVAPLYVPDITSIKQIAPEGISKEVLDSLSERVIHNCLIRLPSTQYSQEKREHFSRIVGQKVDELKKTTDLIRLDTKKIIDLVEDTVVLPSFLSSEELPFDKVTFQHLIKDCEEFFCGAWTSSHPDFQGRLIFSTCDVSPDIVANPSISVDKVVHHGQSYAMERFEVALISAYQKLSNIGSGYVDAYSLRAMVCAELNIQPQVFALCFESFLAKGQIGGFNVYTELPFDTPPPGEMYIEISKRRIGRVKLTN